MCNILVEFDTCVFDTYLMSTLKLLCETVNVKDKIYQI